MCLRTYSEKEQPTRPSYIVIDNHPNLSRSSVLGTAVKISTLAKNRSTLKGSSTIRHKTKAPGLATPSLTGLSTKPVTTSSHKTNTESQKKKRKKLTTQIEMFVRAPRVDVARMLRCRCSIRRRCSQPEHSATRSSPSVHDMLSLLSFPVGSSLSPSLHSRFLV